ncbi:methyltransferase domain-containing protein [Fibrisoma montanum]|uniref:Arsenite methyltransferase n=1 Tax=Fibrisoma montanum TaxID=2305895 RepID=A0A418M5D3_9BACT|nr:arsenite methyltransferase [Fibrisoma montanum]RIV21148.1 methyltransferase domain-containing protein [Fibrisoma montanum]
MTTGEQLKEIVRQKYSDIAGADSPKGVAVDCGCGPTSCCGPAQTGSDYTILMADEYTDLSGYVADADLGLGCGLPTQFAQIKPGDVVVDLGSGAGNDCFVARAETGESGRVIGLDMTEKMIERARQNAEALHYTNVEFVLGDIEAMPLPNDLADVVVSNCVMNLVPDKARAFAETFRILKPGGHFSISDIVLRGDLPQGLQQDAELYAGCVAGAIQKDTYLDLVAGAGFKNITIQKEKEIKLPNELLMNYLTLDELRTYKQQQRGIFSITVYAEK